VHGWRALQALAVEDAVSELNPNEGCPDTVTLLDLSDGRLDVGSGLCLFPGSGSQ
jgi:hypothetical protein